MKDSRKAVVDETAEQLEKLGYSPYKFSRREKRTVLRKANEIKNAKKR